MESFKSRFKKFIKALIRLFPGGHNYLLKMEVDSYGIRYRGLFASYADAKAARKSEAEYDVLNSSKEKKLSTGEEKLDTWFSRDDYPLVYWLHRVLEENTRVLELGGSLGHFFYSAKPYLPQLTSTSWQIAELPEAVRLGTSVARERGEVSLSFLDSQNLSLAEKGDVFLTAGTIQYIDADFCDLLLSLSFKPTHVLLHMLPVHDERSFWTLQDLQRCEVPYRVFSSHQLVSKMRNLGYELIDEWSKVREINIPYYPELSVNRYAGFYFKREECL